MTTFIVLFSLMSLLGLGFGFMGYTGHRGMHPVDMMAGDEGED
ncbi:hypothetical protein [Geobacter sp. DSM 9736]|nr:hypothetical protein [Geobacter sp. DSM 9736]SNB45551.1 hypothetical protein SAMN06269301_0971 [Geobacter sp. DSM 9736]